MELHANYLIRGKLECVTGIHVGGVSETIKIGGTDSPVIIDTLTNLPYIPGSSIKGKMRSLLELKYGDKWLKEGGEVHTCNSPDCDLCIAFGRDASKNVKSGPTRLIVRDSRADAKTIEMWDVSENVMHGTEVKSENFINRISSMATPRFIERVPAGSLFDFEMVFSEYDKKDSERLKLVFEAMSLLEDNYLGASGSRGYGKIRFSGISVLRKSRDDYINGSDWKEVEGLGGGSTPREILSGL